MLYLVPLLPLFPGYRGKSNGGLQSEVYWLILLFICAVPAFAQFSELAVTDDGTQLYFSSALKLIGGASNGRFPEARIYRWTSGGVQLVAERGTLAPTSSFGSGDGAVSPQVTGDGLLFGFTLQNICAIPETPTAPCTSTITRAELRGWAETSLGEGTLQLSRNGQWALVISPSSPRGTPSSTLVNLETGQRTSVPPSPIQARAIASDGSVLVQTGIWRAGAITPLKVSGAVRPLAISDNGQVLVYNQVSMDASGRPNRALLRAQDLTTGNDLALFTPLPDRFQGPQFMSVSSDGRKVLYRVTETNPNGPALLGDTKTGATIAISLDAGELASDGALNGPGNVAFLVTTAGRIVRVEFADDAVKSVQTVIAPTPFVSLTRNFAPGALVRLPRFADGQYILDGKLLTVVSSTADQVAVQVPWEQRTGQVTFSVDAASNSPFRQEQLANVFPTAPSFEPADPGTSSIFPIKIIKGDFSGFQTTPPGPGSIVHIYMTGLGRVQGTVQTGVPAPVDSLRPLVSTVRCQFTPQTTYADTLFAGLAPGMTGIYQLTFRIPTDPIPTIFTGMQCMLNGADGSSSFGFGVFAPAPTPSLPTGN